MQYKLERMCQLTVPWKSPALLSLKQYLAPLKVLEFEDDNITKVVALFLCRRCMKLSTRNGKRNPSRLFTEK